MTGASVPFIRRLGSGLLDRFETRKVIFETANALENDVEQAIEKAVTFELLWLECKQDHYQRMSDEDTDRLRMLRARKASLLPPKSAPGT